MAAPLSTRNPALEAEAEKRRMALEEQAGTLDADLQADPPVALPMPAAAPAPAGVAAMGPVVSKPVYGADLNDAALKEAYEKQRGANFMAQMTNAGALMNRAGGGHMAQNAGDIYLKTADQPVKAILGRRGAVDAERKAQDQADQENPESQSSRLRQWLNAQAGVLTGMSPEDQGKLAGSDLVSPQDIFKGRMAQQIAATKAGAKGGGQAAAGNALIDFVKNKYGNITPEQEKSLRAAVDAGAKPADVRPYVQPSYTVQFDPTTGAGFTRERHGMAPPTAFQPPSAPGGSTSPNPKEAAQWKKDLGSAQPPAGWSFQDDYANARKPIPLGAAGQHKTAAQVQATDAFVRQLVPLQQIVARHPDGVLMGPEAAEAEKYAQEALTTLRQAQDMGVYRPGEQPLLDRILPDPSRFGVFLKSITDYRPLTAALNAAGKAVRVRGDALAASAGWQHAAGGASEAPAAPEAANPNEKVVNGRKFVRENGKWYVEE